MSTTARIATMTGAVTATPIVIDGLVDGLAAARQGLFRCQTRCRCCLAGQALC